MEALRKIGANFVGFKEGKIVVDVAVEAISKLSSQTILFLLFFVKEGVNLQEYVFCEKQLAVSRDHLPAILIFLVFIYRQVSCGYKLAALIGILTPLSYAIVSRVFAVIHLLETDLPCIVSLFLFSIYVDLLQIDPVFLLLEAQLSQILLITSEAVIYQKVDTLVMRGDGVQSTQEYCIL